MCVLVAAVSVSVSGWTLVAISVERFYAICHPLVSRFTERRDIVFLLLPFSCKTNTITEYFALSFPTLLQTSRKWQTRSHARYIILAVWLGSLAIMSPVAVLSELKPVGNDGTPTPYRHTNYVCVPFASVYTVLFTSPPSRGL